MTHNIGFKKKTMTIWLLMALLGSFIFSAQTLNDPVSMTVLPQVPKAGEPVYLSFTFNNPSLSEKPYVYELYVNGELAMEGESTISALSTKQKKYTYLNEIDLGEQTTFFLKVKTPDRTIQKTLSIPVYAPQVWTSFVSIASYSMMLTDYNSAFAPSRTMNVGLIFTLVLIPMLTFLILSEPFSGVSGTIGRLNKRFSNLSAVMFIIFMGMVVTQMAMIIWRLG